MDSHCVDLRALRAILGGEIVGQQVLCPGPGHSTGDRSLAVRPTENGRSVCHSFAGDDWRECQDYVRERLGLPRWREQRQEQPVLHPLRRTLPQNDPQNVARAKRLWDEGHDPRIPLVTDYLASRKLYYRRNCAGRFSDFTNTVLGDNILISQLDLSKIEQVS